MAKASGGNEPRTFYLNERHELARGELTGGGSLPKYAPIDWKSKGERISRSLETAKETISRSKDPLKDRHYFLLARAETSLKKVSKNRKKAPTGTYLEETDYSGEQSRVFRRLGMDLLSVNSDGTATVHATPEKVDQLSRTADSLDTEGQREQARWAPINSFGVIPADLRIDSSWLAQLPAREPVDAVIELQPLLRRVEVDTLLRAIAAILNTDRDEGLLGTGADFSGRQWLRGKIARESLQNIARTFYSVDSLHSPLRSLAASRTERGRTALPAASAPPREPDIRRMPCVAVVDAGVPADHLQLGHYRRGQYLDPNCSDRPLGDHGSRVASRIVFGDPDFADGLGNTPTGSCAFYDVLVSLMAPYIEDKSVVPAMEAVVATAPDVRVFNLSFDSKSPLSQLGEVDKRNYLFLVQELDNFIFARDVIVVVAAGNSPPGTVPTRPYPDHYAETPWGLGSWSQSFNAVTCGSYVQRLSANGIVRTVGWPSPFTRIGPGMCEQPKPDFCEHGGNWGVGYRYAPGCGVWALDDQGRWEDRSGTSYAAPMLAREAAFAIQDLQTVCQQGARPYAATVKAFLVLAARPTTSDSQIEELARRSLGRGKTNSSRLSKPIAETAVFVWQGVIEGPDDVCRLQIPVPKKWLNTAEAPHLRLVAAWESPVNAAASSIWASRRITVKVRATPDARALTSRSASHSSYTILDRLYDLKQKNAASDDDLWLVEIAYEQIADYYPGLVFSPQQRVGLAAELIDHGQAMISAQSAVQALPIAASMTRLSVPPAASRVPVILPTRI